STVEPVTEPSVALMVDVPCDTAVARPWLPALFEIVATEVLAEAQVTWVVRSWVDPSLKVPTASNCSVRPFGTLGLAGVTAIDCNVAAELTVIVPDIPPAVPFPLSKP